MPTLAELRAKKKTKATKVKIKLTHEADGNEKEDSVEIVSLLELRKRMVEEGIIWEDRRGFSYLDEDEWPEERRAEYLALQRKSLQRMYLNQSLKENFGDAVAMGLCKTAKVLKAGAK